MPRPTAGQLRHPIRIESLAQARDAHGGMVKTWTLYAAPRAKISNMSGNESPATGPGGGQTGEARTEFVTRFIPGIDTSMRIVYADRSYNIKHVNDFAEEHRFLVITCDTGAGDG